MDDYDKAVERLNAAKRALPSDNTLENFVHYRDGGAVEFVPLIVFGAREIRYEPATRCTLCGTMLKPADLLPRILWFDD
jgi:hypothetical protein